MPGPGGGINLSPLILYLGYIPTCIQFCRMITFIVKVHNIECLSMIFQVKKECIVQELDAAMQKVNSFLNCGNIDLVDSYNIEANAVFESLKKAQEKIEDINSEEVAYDWELSNYPLRQKIITKLNPYLRLYGAVTDFKKKHL